LGRVLFKDEEFAKLESEYYWTWEPPEMKPGDFPWHTFWEIAAFMFLAFPMGLTFSAWAQGYLAPEEMDWIALITNVLALGALAGLWPFIRMANHNLARVMREKRAQRRGLIL